MKTKDVLTNALYTALALSCVVGIVVVDFLGGF